MSNSKKVTNSITFGIILIFLVMFCNPSESKADITQSGGKDYFSGLAYISGYNNVMITGSIENKSGPYNIYFNVYDYNKNELSIPSQYKYAYLNGINIISSTSYYAFGVMDFGCNGSGDTSCTYFDSYLTRNGSSGSYYVHLSAPYYPYMTGIDGILTASLSFSDTPVDINSLVTPIPPAFLLMGSGIVGLFGIRKRLQQLVA
jgi:hypothetical protein